MAVQISVDQGKLTETVLSTVMDSDVTIELSIREYDTHYIDYRLTRHTPYSCVGSISLCLSEVRALECLLAKARYDGLIPDESS